MASVVETAGLKLVYVHLGSLKELQMKIACQPGRVY